MSESLHLLNEPPVLKPTEVEKFTPWSEELQFGWTTALWWLSDRSFKLLKHHDICEESGNTDPSIDTASLRLTVRDGLRPTYLTLPALTDYVFATIIQPILSRPPAHAMSAIEARLKTKFFHRATKRALGGIPAALKVFALQLANPMKANKPLSAFYAMIYPEFDRSNASLGSLLRHHTDVLRVAIQCYWDVAPNLPDDDIERLRQTVSSWYAHHYGPPEEINIDVPPAGFDPVKSELEAMICATLTVLKSGMPSIKTRSRAEMLELRNWYPFDASSEVDYDAFISQIQTLDSKNPNPMRNGEIVAPQASPTPDSTTRPQLNAEKIGSLASYLSSYDSDAPFTWACQAVADRFLEMKLRTNAIIECKPHTLTQSKLDEAQLFIAREAYEPALNTELKNRPHLIRYIILYPDNWTNNWDRDRRFEVFHWLALIDLVERFNEGKKDASGKRAEELRGGGELKRRCHYDEASLRACNYYAAALDAFAGEPAENSKYDIGLACATLRSNPLAWDFVSQSPPLLREIGDCVDLETSWRAILDEATPLELRRCLLFRCNSTALTEEQCGDITQLIENSLARVDLHPDWRDTLIEAASSLHHHLTLPVRNRLTDSILGHARKIREATATESDFSLRLAVKVLGLIAPEDRVALLADFLRPDDDRRVQICALASLSHVFYYHPPRISTVVDPVLEAARRLFLSVLDPTLLLNDDAAALLVASLKAMAAMADSELLPCVEKLATFEIRPINMLVRRKVLNHLLASWKSIVDVPTVERDRLQASIAQIEKGITLLTDN